MILLKSDIAKESIPAANKRLRELLDEREPRVVRALARTWNMQARDLTYQEIRQMLLTDTVDSATIKRWQDDYSRFVVKCLMPEWKVMIAAAVNELSSRFPAFAFDPASEGIAQYTATRAAELVTNSSAQQIEAVRALIQRANLARDITVDELSLLVRPVVGLYKGQATANFNYYLAQKQFLLEANPHMRLATAQKRARAAAVKFAEQQHRYRAMMIARTELSFGYNNGEYHAVRQAQDAGMIGQVVKKWSTAGDGRVCDICRALHGKTAALNESFPGAAVSLPPLHPHCRCGVQYIETGRVDTIEEIPFNPLQSRQSNGTLLSNGSVIPDNPYTKLDYEKTFDFTNQKLINHEINQFIKEYAFADTEHTLILSPLGKKYGLTGTSGSVDPSIIGREALAGSIGIHNHPVSPGLMMDDSFSLEDLMFCADFQTIMEFLVSGKRRNAVVFKKTYTSEEISKAYEKTRMKVYQLVSDKKLDDDYFLQEEIMKRISDELEGVKFYEHL